MAKYIDAEKLKVRIAQIQKEHPYNPYSENYESGCHEGYLGCCDELLSLIDSLQQEYPSLPDNLDEAAEKYSNVHYYETMLVGDLAEGFKAGAKWMAGQGITVTGDTDDEYIRILEDIEEAICEIAPDSTVNIQIRK